MLRDLAFILKTFFVYTLLSVGCFLMLRTIVNYASFETDIQFLAIKQDYIHISVWLAAFYIHVFTAIIALLAGFTQFSSDLLRDHRKLHRFLGLVYAYDILLINFPAGLVMAYYANGGPPGRFAFLLLDGLWFYFTYKAVAHARARDFKRHRQFMIRSYALTFSAIMLRTWKIIFNHLFIIDPGTLYIIDAYMGFVPNLLAAEWIIRSGRKEKKLAASPSSS